MKPPRIRSGAYRSLLIASAFGSGILVLPRYLCAYAHQDAWVCVIAAGVPLCLAAVLCGRAGGIPEEWPPFIQGLFSVLYAGYFFAVAAISVRSLSEVANAFLLPQTPLFVIEFCFVLLILFALRGGPFIVAHFSELTRTFLPLTLFLLLPSLFSAQGTSLSPVLVRPIAEWLHGVPVCLYIFSFTTLQLAFQQLSEAPKHKSRPALISALAVIAPFTAVVLLSVAAFGPDLCSRIAFPVITLYKTIPVPVIERMDLFFLVFWMILSVRPCINFSCAGVQLLHRFFKAESTGRTVICISACLLLYGLVLLLRDMTLVLECTVLLGYCLVPFGIFFPVLFLVFRKKVTNQ